ncbi:rac GTPase-activating protein 1 [Teleopsis dalmanni]|uniref:rac GTPase-activating protein 1 n=1 Tax=Teleopsis dalmanni TaxID=139649 RepID=UPI0018CF54C0|nr:rac GTPase-activating protein 1 [Teleopsis dalmanni]
MNTPMLSTLASFDDIRRCMQVLKDGTAEEEFLRLLRLQEKFRQECFTHAQETQRIQKELDASLQSMADLETKLFHARRLLEMESKARRDAEHDREQLEKKIVAVADLLQNERNLKDETKDKLAFLNTIPRKRKSLNRHIEEKYGNDINSTGSFLSDLSITQSEDDFLDVRHSKSWQKHRPSIPKNSIPCTSTKRSRLSGAGMDSGVQSTPPITTRRSTTRRSGVGVQKHTLNIAPGTERICATTKVTIPQAGNGIIRTESIIESEPLRENVNEIFIVNDPSTPKKTGFFAPSAPPMTPGNKLGTPGCMQTPSKDIRPTPLRNHNFTSKTFIRADTCAQCKKKIRFGAVGLRCRDCPIRCHVDCRNLLNISCVPQTNTPTLKGMGFIAEYAPAIAPMIPALIIHCVNEIESRGLNEVGIYRVSGSEREVKALKERFLRGKSMPHLSDFDIHVLCGCIKDFLRSLREPLIPTCLWKHFCNAVQNVSEDDIKKELRNAISCLPQANRDTLAFLILHFQRVALCREVLMPIDNIARVFGPTIVGYSSPDPDQQAILTEVYTQYSVMLNLLKLETDYWHQYVSLDKDKENQENIDFGCMTPKNNKESLYVQYATPFKSTLKKRKFYGTPPIPHKK